VLLAFEAAERESDPEQQRPLTFVIVGGGRPASNWRGRWPK
jgi:NADH dehydrogenase FAD-containing subunit